jgi:hypothetical protein
MHCDAILVTAHAVFPDCLPTMHPQCWALNFRLDCPGCGSSLGTNWVVTSESRFCQSWNWYPSFAPISFRYQPRLGSATFRFVASLGAAGAVSVAITTMPWLVLATVCPNVVGHVAYWNGMHTGASVSHSIALGQGIHTVGADGQGLWHVYGIGHLHHSPSTELHCLSGIALHS